MLAIVVAWTPGAFRLGAGPALQMAHWKAEDFQLQPVAQSSASPLGLVVDTGLRSSVRSRVFLDFDVQYRWSTATVGPFAGMNSIVVTLNQLRLGLGLGVRF